MILFDPLTKTNIFHSDLVTRHLAANFFLVGLATTLVALRFVVRRICRTKVWYVKIGMLTPELHDLTRLQVG